MTAECIEVEPPIAADAAAIFRTLFHPQGHVAIDSSEMLMAVTGEPVTAVGDTGELGRPSTLGERFESFHGLRHST